MLKRMTSKVSLKLNSKDMPASVRIMRSNLPYVSKRDGNCSDWPDKARNLRLGAGVARPVD